MSLMPHDPYDIDSLGGAIQVTLTLAEVEAMREQARHFKAEYEQVRDENRALIRARDAAERELNAIRAMDAHQLEQLGRGKGPS